MISLLTSCELFLRLGLVYSILAMGYYVSYTILDFPDLTVEGTFLGGAVMYGIFVSHGISGWLGIIAAFAVGGLFGALTGVLNVKLKVRPLLCGILVSTALISVNLVATSAGAAAAEGRLDLSGELFSTINFARSDAAIKNQFPFSLIPARAGAFQPRLDLLFLFFALLVKILLDLFLDPARASSARRRQQPRVCAHACARSGFNPHSRPCDRQCSCGGRRRTLHIRDGQRQPEHGHRHGRYRACLAYNRSFALPPRAYNEGYDKGHPRRGHLSGVPCCGD